MARYLSQFTVSNTIGQFNLLRKLICEALDGKKGKGSNFRHKQIILAAPNHHFRNRYKITQRYVIIAFLEGSRFDDVDHVSPWVDVIESRRVSICQETL